MECHRLQATSKERLCHILCSEGLCEDLLVSGQSGAFYELIILTILL